MYPCVTGSVMEVGKVWLVILYSRCKTLGVTFAYLLIRSAGTLSTSYNVKGDWSKLTCQNNFYFQENNTEGRISRRRSAWGH